MKHATPEADDGPAMIAVDASHAPTYVRELLGGLVTWDMTDEQVTALATASALELPTHVTLGLAFLLTHDLIRDLRDDAPTE